MLLSGEEYSKRLDSYSDDTIRLISEITLLPREEFKKGRDITADSELSEAEVVERLESLLEAFKKQKK